MIQSYVSSECSYLTPPKSVWWSEVWICTAAKAHSTPCYLKELNCTPPLFIPSFTLCTWTRGSWLTYRISLYTHMDPLLSWFHISKSNLNLFRLLSNQMILDLFSQSTWSVSVYLGCQDVEVASAISPADEFTPVIWRHSRVLWYPHHRGGDTVIVEIKAIGLTLLLTESLTYTETRGGRVQKVRGGNAVGGKMSLDIVVCFDDSYLCQGSGSGCRTGIWPEPLGSIYPHLTELGCYILFSTVECHLHMCVSRNRTGPIYPSGHPPGNTQTSGILQKV